LVMTAIYILIYRRFFNKTEIFALVGIYPMVAITVVIEYFFSNVLIEVFASSVANLLMLNIIEKPEIIYDSELGLKKYGAFTTDSYKAMVTKKEVTLVFVKIVNEFQIIQKLNYVEQIEYRKTVGNIIKETAKDFSMKGEFYWLGQGQYSAAIQSKSDQDSESYAMTLRRRLNVPIKTNFGIMDLYSNIALARCPFDIDTSEKSTSFIENFYHIGGVLEDVLNLSNVENKKDFEIKMNLSTIIKQAIMNDSLEVYYQPIYSTKEKKFTRAEALLRLKDEKYGFIPPTLFLPEAERNGTIYKIGDIVFDSVCRFIASDDFNKCGLEKVEINLSVIQCMHEDLPIHLMDAIKRYGVSPDKINLDITETSDPYSKKMMDENIKILKELGFSFSLDDYGSGYSNMDNVSSMPVDVIKVTNNQSNNPDVQVMIDHSIQMIKDLKRKIVVEGVETEEMLNNYEGYLCDYIQGFYFSKPLPKQDFVDFVINENKSRSNNDREESAT
nr:EAL domain-containing protein [Acholeplasmatales bacterium]